MKNFSPDELLYNSELNLYVDGEPYFGSDFLFHEIVEYTGGSARGTFRFIGDDNNTNQFHDVYIVFRTWISNLQGTNFDNLSGRTSTFSVYPSNHNNIFKKNEDFDASKTISDLRFQESMLDKSEFFENFLGTVLGNSESDENSIGKKIYERISNFVPNTQDIDVCNEQSIHSMGDFVGYDIDLDHQYPNNIKRLVDLSSISKNNLLGNTNKFRQNFDVRNQSSKEIYGVNIGDIIDTSTYTVSANVPIVALEKFSNKYVLLENFQSSQINNFKYKAIEGIDSRIAGENPLTTKRRTSEPPVRINLPTCWANDVDLSGISLNSGYYIGTLLTRRHLAIAKHFVDAGIYVGQVFRFLSPDDVVYDRTSIGLKYVDDSDIAIFLLDSDLPSDIKSYKICPPHILQTINSDDRIPQLYLDQEANVLVTDFQDTIYGYIGWEYRTKIPVDATRLSFYEAVVLGDSNAPNGFIIDDEFVLIGLTTTYGNVGNMYGFYIRSIQSDIDYLNSQFGVTGEYNLEVYDTNTLNLGTAPLSDYNVNWGWPLVLPTEFNTRDFDKYYTFFDYVDGFDSRLIGGVLDMDNDMTTIPLSSTNTDLFGNNGIVENLFSKTLYKSLSLI